MLILLDDVQFKSEKDFFVYMSKSFGKGEDGISSGDELVNAIDAYDGDLEFYIYDAQDVEKENQGFASDMIKLILDCREKNSEHISVFYRSGDEGI